ncbi:probable leucine-rich repeat receptor-like protein kinase At5g49770 [Pistacia vera]|uniref:probable leucine-rich repeat receptor-like protein kinase At5g49770 n=1 Tax=Pistacia vera TaxID=55513 RepID=UPI001263CED3|nr:probable leucine-rich repeat receptor-like protein kinase At5g49770 [Pistacia vera]
MQRLTNNLHFNIQILSVRSSSMDLSQNKGLTGTLTPSIGKLTKLVSLVLTGCSFSGLIPDTLGSLTQLVNLNLNSNSFNGPIPASIGNLTKLVLLDLTDNQLNGTIPVSNETSPGLDGLVNALHFHFGRNQLTGPVPLSLFSSGMKLIHVLFDNNNFTGNIPSSLDQAQSLQVIRMDNNSFTGTVDLNFTNFPNITTIHFSNNQLTGRMPDLTGVSSLRYVDMSNNSFEVSTIPPWFSSLPALTSLIMENTQLQGSIPVELFSLPRLESVVLKNNQLSGALDIGPSYGSELQLIDLQNNSIDSVEATGYNKTLYLYNNPICENSEEYNCSAPQVPSSSPSTPTNSCEASSSPPIIGTLYFRSFTFSNWKNASYYSIVRDEFMNSFKKFNLPVDSMSVTFQVVSANDYLELHVEVCPSVNGLLDRTNFSLIISQLNNISFVTLGPIFGPFYYNNINPNPVKNSPNVGIIIGATVGGFILLVLLVIAGMYAIHQRKKAVRATRLNDPFASWDVNDPTSRPQINGVRCFPFEELKKCTNNFSNTKILGSGGYGQVYKGRLETGLIVAIKRAMQGSLQGRNEFKSEVELLSRVHHKNVVSLVGFCYEQGEQMLVYEFIQNGTLKDSLSGKLGIQLSWIGRLRIALDSARGLAYLHELANPTIIHRDIKSNNILLDDSFNAKVADFGLSKTLGGSENNEILTDVKGTPGYLDPEYFRTRQLTKKSDVYSFGVVMAELITGRSPIQRGSYIVSELKMAMDRTKNLYNLHEMLDPAISGNTTLSGLENFVDLAMMCVEDLGANRPTMSEVVKEIENILQLADSDDLQSEPSVFSISFN